MTTSTATLAEFLLARIDEDEAAARRATHRGGWVNDGITTAHIVTRQDDVLGELRATVDAEHIVRHDPARVLTECEAKRAMVSHFAPAIDEGNGYGMAAERALSLLAKPYASHPDFRDEWRA